MFAEKGQGRAREEREPGPAEVWSLRDRKGIIRHTTRKITQIDLTVSGGSHLGDEPPQTVGLILSLVA